MTRTSRLAHRATVALMSVAVLVATGDGFAQSYSGLLRWATKHHVTGWKADSFPLLVDLFILVGELGLFALALEGHKVTRRALSWLDLAVPAGIAAAGWIVSLLFNVGSVDHQLSDQLTAAVPPVASMLGLLVLLRTLHRLVGRPVFLKNTAEVVPAEVAQALELVPGEAGTAAAERPVEGLLVTPGSPHQPVPEPVPASPRRIPSTYPAPGPHLVQAASAFADDLDRGDIPSIRAIKRTLQIGQPRAGEVREYLTLLAQHR